MFFIKIHIVHAERTALGLRLTLAHPLHSTSAVSYTHLDVYKRQALFSVIG